MVRRAAALAGLSAAAFVLWLLFGPTDPGFAHPPVPEGPGGIVQCRACHAAGASQLPAGTVPVPPLPTDHAAYASESCVTCHVSIVGSSPLAASYAECATCHAKEGAATTLGSGEKLSLSIDISRYRTSVHRSFACTECHDVQVVPHEALTTSGRRAFSQEMSDICQRCHEGATASYEESVHGTAARLGIIRAATCADCHTAHAVQPKASWSLADRAEGCATCHQGATASFASGWLGHKEPSPGWFPQVFYAQKGFVALTAIVLGIGIVHVELDFLRWFWNRVRRRPREEP